MDEEILYSSPLSPLSSPLSTTIFVDRATGHRHTRTHSRWATILWFAIKFFVVAVAAASKEEILNHQWQPWRRLFSIRLHSGRLRSPSAAPPPETKAQPLAMAQLLHQLRWRWHPLSHPPDCLPFLAPQKLLPCPSCTPVWSLPTLCSSGAATTPRYADFALYSLLRLYRSRMCYMEFTRGERERRESVVEAFLKRLGCCFTARVCTWRRNSMWTHLVGFRF
jgi:hypothetical protein